MKIPKGRAVGALRQLVRYHATSYTITRGDGSRAAMGVSREGESTHSAEVYLFMPRTVAVDTPYGERLDGDLNGLALPGEDLEHDDSLQHGGTTYEIDDLFHLPSEDDKEIKVVNLVRVTNTS